MNVSNNQTLNDTNTTAEATQTNILNKSFSINPPSAIRSHRKPRPPLPKLTFQTITTDFRKAFEEIDNEPICLDETDCLPETEQEPTTNGVDHDDEPTWHLFNSPERKPVEKSQATKLIHVAQQAAYEKPLFQTPNPKNNFTSATPKDRLSTIREATPKMLPLQSHQRVVPSSGVKVNARPLLNSRVAPTIRTPTVASTFEGKENDVPHTYTARVQDRYAAASMNDTAGEENDRRRTNATKIEKPSDAAVPIVAEQNRVISVNGKRYVVLHELGKGGSSVVYNCYDAEMKKETAIKRVSLNGDATINAGYINEVRVLQKLQNYDKIIKMFDYEIKPLAKELLVVLEKGSFDLHRILKLSINKSTLLPPYRIIFYWMEMLYAVKQIHENGIIHSDLKPANFLMAEGQLKLIDFGIASCIQGDCTSVIKNVRVGSFNYISPEALSDNRTCGSPSGNKPKFKINCKSDVWSLGCILYELIYRKTPFHHIGHLAAKLSTILDPNHRINFPVVEGMPINLMNATKMCLRYAPEMRPTVDELINMCPYK